MPDQKEGAEGGAKDTPTGQGLADTQHVHLSRPGHTGLCISISISTSPFPLLFWCWRPMNAHPMWGWGRVKVGVGEG
jgi:hypothetical protein